MNGTIRKKNRKKKRRGTGLFVSCRAPSFHRYSLTAYQFFSGIMRRPIRWLVTTNLVLYGLWKPNAFKFSNLKGRIRWKTVAWPPASSGRRRVSLAGILSQGGDTYTSGNFLARFDFLDFHSDSRYVLEWKEVSRLLRTDGLLFEIFSNVLLTVCLWRPLGFHHRGACYQQAFPKSHYSRDAKECQISRS